MKRFEHFQANLGLILHTFTFGQLSRDFRRHLTCQLQPLFKSRQYNGGGGILVYIRQGIPAKRLQSLEPKGIESIFLKLLLENKSGA